MPSKFQTTGAALGAAAVVASGAGIAAAAPIAPAPSTNTAPIAAVLADAGTTLATYRFANNSVTSPRPITGLTGDTAIVGIDFRVQDGKLYGVGNASGLYTIGLNGAARKVKTLTVALSGTSFGVDFNPAANALRVVSDTGQNLRQPFSPNVRAATINDGSLNYTAGVTASGITSAAYTNNDLSTDSGTTLFVVDSTLDQLAIQAPANNGSLSVTGKLGLDAGPAVGFDIFSTLDANGRANGATGYLVLPADFGANLYTVDLLGGQATLQQALPLAAVDIAVVPVGTTPAA